MIDSAGRLGTFAASADPGGFSPKQGMESQAIPDAGNQAILHMKVQNLRATVAQQQQQIETLTTQLKENAAQIQKANAQLEMDKPAAKVVVNKR